MSREAESIISTLIPFWEESEEPWGARDDASIFMFANRRFCELLNLPRDFSVEGRTDEELPASVSEFQKEFRIHDRACMTRRDRATSFEVHPYEKEQNMQPWFFDKFPIVGRDRQVLGTIFHGRPVGALMLNRLNRLTVPTSLVFTPPTELFTPREWEIIFYLIQQFTTREICARLQLKRHTVCNYVQNIFSKAGVSSRSQLIEYCYAHNIANYIPESFFERSESIVIR
ncbi:PAS domain-containing protein [Erwinia sp. E602]|uniref:helix-turn-helix transcriptional regulator n=1 Tax=Erwinia sp. E602 TaxID=2675378 RepID=UPI001BAC47D2|nr:PAS and helix-turn-helix domain-containing protein [Erwinia sp. E602]QUG77375.1 PAS domain-containing protein [Erwinia sp. E602]